MDITVKQLKEKLDAGEDFVLIDVRETHEHEDFNIGGELVPLGTVADEIEKLKQHKDKEVVVYCRSGGRSGRAQQFLQSQGFSNVINLQGGMLAWVEEFGR